MNSMSIFGYVLGGCFSLIIICLTIKCIATIFKDKKEDKKEDKGE